MTGAGAAVGSPAESVNASRAFAPASSEVLQIGMLLCAVVWMNTRVLGSDNFIVPKLLVLTSAAFAAALLLAVEAKALRFERLDLALLPALLLLIPSSLNAVNRGYAVAAAGAFASSILLFWVSRSLAAGGRRSELLLAGTVAIGVLVGVALLEAYTGLQFSSRPPGAMVGNRNRLAHLAVIGLPSLALLAARVRGPLAAGGLATLAAMSGGLILLSRSRAAWLALVAMIVVGALLLAVRALPLAPPSPRARRRLALLVGSVLAGGVLALLLPNRLEWVSTSPYRDSLATIVDYREGTGAGRVIEYRNTLSMIRDRPLLGVGPGNWRVHYPAYASEDDPNLGVGVVPMRRYPQSEWLGGAAERGVASLLALGVVFGVLLRRWGIGLVRDGAGCRAGACAAGILTMVALGVVGLFDPVIQTPVAGFIVPVLLGSLATVPLAAPPIRLGRAARVVTVACMVGTGALLVSARVRDVWATYLYGYNPTLESLERAARIDPGNYTILAITAAILTERGRCDAAAPHVEAARRMYPASPGLDALEARCQGGDQEGEREEAEVAEAEGGG